MEPEEPFTSSQSNPPPSTSSGISGIIAASASVHPDVRNRKTIPESVNPFTLAAAARGKMSEQRRDQCRRAVTGFIVKGLLPFSTVEAPWWREMISTLNPQYQSPSRDMLSNTLIPAWYAVEIGNLKRKLQVVADVAVTADGWTSVVQDHYLTVTVHYVKEGSMKENHKVVAITVDNAANMDVAVKKMNIIKIGCFAHTLNIAAQKLYNVPSVSRWAGRIRAMVVWLKRSSLAKPVLKEKQKLLGLPEHAVILDVKNRWNSLFLMVERFLEQFPAIQAAAMDARLKRTMEKDRLERVTDDDFRKAEFVKVMKLPLCTSTLCMSAERIPTLGQILPILGKLEHHFTISAEDSTFTQCIKEKIWGDLSKRYQEECIQQFLEESTALDLRFKSRVAAADAVWDRVKKELINRATTHQEIFAEEDMAIEVRAKSITSTSEKIQEEIQLYRGLPCTLSTVNPATWWWSMKDTLPMLSSLAARKLTMTVVTRRGSTYEMISRFLEKQQAVCAVLAKHRNTWHLMPKDNDIATLENVNQLLQPLYDLTDALASEKRVALSSLTPVLEHISSEILSEQAEDNLLRQMKQVMREDLQGRYTKMVERVLRDLHLRGCPISGKLL
ncbi:unnamed protein product [Leuciscus chuanchicus]